MFRSVLYRSYKDEERVKSNVSEKICFPDKNTTMGMKYMNYDKLDSDGIISVGSKCDGNDILVGKTIPITTPTDISNLNNAKFTQKDVSLALRETDHGVIDQVMVSSNEEGKLFTKIRTRSVRIPEIGDKLALRHGQKGTIGMIYGQEDLPFTKEGITPDVIINSHALPSRKQLGLRTLVIGFWSILC